MLGYVDRCGELLRHLRQAHAASVPQPAT
jgi:hypothetical protein